MSGYQNAKAVNLIAGEDLRGDLYEILKFEDDSDVAKVIKATAVTDTVIGVLAEEPRTDATTDGEVVPVAIIGGGGVLQMKCGATVTAGQLVVPDTTAGRIAGVANAGALAVDSMAIGVALTSGVDGDVIDVLAMPIGAPHSA